MAKTWTFWDAATAMGDVQSKLDLYCAPLRLAIDALETCSPADMTGTTEMCSNTLLLVLFKLLELQESMQPAIDAAYQRSTESKEDLSSIRKHGGYVNGQDSSATAFVPSTHRRQQGGF